MVAFELGGNQLLFLAAKREITWIYSVHWLCDLAGEFDSNYIFTGEKLVFGVQAQLVIGSMQVDAVYFDITLALLLIFFNYGCAFYFQVFLVEAKPMAGPPNKNGNGF
jgi:hypothetical protein